MPALTKKDLDVILEKCDAQITNYRTLIETGSHVGDTIFHLKDFFDKIYTIEISEHYYNIVNGKFAESEKIKCILGDTSKILPNLLFVESEKIIFWLDAHWSSGDTGKGDLDCPLLEELYIIDNSCKDSIIIIDDYRLFGTKGNEDWSDITLPNIMSKFTKNNIKKIFVEGDRLIILI
jgi:hypothetical protein